MSQRPFRFFHLSRLNWGRGYTSQGLSGFTFSAQGVISVEVVGFQSAARVEAMKPNNSIAAPRTMPESPAVGDLLRV